MFNLLNLNIVLTSALEQFEILTLGGPELGFGWRVVGFFIPTGFTNNLTWKLCLLIFMLYNLCSFKRFLPTLDPELKNYYLAEFEKLPNKDELLVKILEKQAKKKVSDDRSNLDIAIESTFIIYTTTNFVYNRILENLGYKKSIFLNYTLALFLFLLACNLFGMIPYSLTVTSFLILTLNFSGMSFFANLLIAIETYSLNFFKFFIPGGVSGLLVILMVVIELISYAARLFSMAIRLFANMLSGHALIKILSGLVFLTFSDIYFFGIINVFLTIILWCVTALEVIVAALQSYVFVVLSTIYTNEAIILH